MCFSKPLITPLWQGRECCLVTIMWEVFYWLPLTPGAPSTGSSFLLGRGGQSSFPGGSICNALAGREEAPNAYLFLIHLHCGGRFHHPWVVTEVHYCWWVGAQTPCLSNTAWQGCLFRVCWGWSLRTPCGL